MKQSKLLLVILIAVMLLAAIPVKAADSVKISGTLNIKHRLGTVENHTGKSGEGNPNAIDSKLAYDIHKNEVIEIWVDDPNPFIYNYKFNLQKTETEDYTAITKFIDAIKPFLAVVDKTKNVGGGRGGFYKEQGLDDTFLKGLSSDIKKLTEIAEKIPGYILDTTIESKMSGIAEDIANKETWGCDLRKNFDDAYKIINNAQMKFLEKFGDLKGNENKENIEDDFFLTSTMLSFAQDQKANIMELLDKVESFKKTFYMINVPINLGTVTYNEKEKIIATVEISFTNTEFEKKFDKKLKTGSFDFIFEPYITFKYRFGVSQILSTFKDVDENGKEKNFQLQVPMLTIILQKWADWKLSPILQLGFTLKDDIKHLLIGPGIRVLENFYVGGGAHLRWGKDSLLRLGGYLNLSFTPLKLN